MTDAGPWLVVVPRLAGAQELHQLAAPDQAQLYKEISHVAGVLQTETGCEKINIGALGNSVRQLHIHIVARNMADANWPGPVWGYGRRQPYARDAQDWLAGHLRVLLQA